METKTRMIMFLKITLEIFEMMFELKKKSLVTVMKQCECRKEELHDMLQGKKKRGGIVCAAVTGTSTVFVSN